MPALALHPALEAAARAHAQDMACHNFLSHIGSDGSQPPERMVRFGYHPPANWGEILFMGMDGFNSLWVALDWWMNSQVHRQTLLSPQLTEMGVGYAYASARDAGYYVVVFGRPR